MTTQTPQPTPAGAGERHRLMEQPEVRLCPACRSVNPRFAEGPGGRPLARCAGCNALERHRFLAALLRGMRGRITGAIVLDVAPSKPITAVLRELSPRRLVQIDFDPAADGRTVDARASLTGLPLADRTVDLLICYHVLEHIPDDHTAMRELARVLTPTGVAVIQVPFRPNAATDEDPTADAATRIRRFGQADHVRWYGRDFEDRLERAGLRQIRVSPVDVVGSEVATSIAVRADEFVWLAAPTAHPGPVDLTALTRQTLAELVLMSAHQSLTLQDSLARANRRLAKSQRLLSTRRSETPGARRRSRRAARRNPLARARRRLRRLARMLPPRPSRRRGSR